MVRSSSARFVIAVALGGAAFPQFRVEAQQVARQTSASATTRIPEDPKSGTRLLRQPSVSATHIAFMYATNVWIVERAGGSARRLTSFPGETGNPKISPDGRMVAFNSTYAGNADVFVVPVEGGEPRRLTWHPAGDVVQGWTPDGRSVVFSSGRASNAPTAAPRFWTVPLAGGVEEPMPMPRAFQGKISPDGRRVAYRMNNSWDEERRNYRGGQNRPIWIMDLASHDVVTPPWTDSKDIDPVWVGETVFFLSDRDGVSNVWSFDTRAKQLKQATKFTDFDVKTLDAGAGTLVFEQAGYIHELEPASGRTRIVNITAAGDFPWMMAQWKDVSTRVTNLALSPTGKRAAVEARGEIFTVPAEKGDPRNLTNSTSSAEREPAWSPDGRFVSYFSDRSGEYRLYIESQDGLGIPREIVLPEPSHYYTPAWSPDGKRMVFHDTHLRLWVLDVATGKPKVVDTDPWMVPERSLNPAWSPDSRWIAYVKRLPSLYRAVFAHNVETGETKQITDGLADVTSPAWDASGKYLWFLASTNFALNSAWLDMSSYDRPQTRALYLTVLRKSEPSPLLPESDEEAARDSARPTPARDTTARTAPPPPPTAPDAPDRLPPRAIAPVQIDFDGIHQRIIAVSGIAQRNYSDLRAGPTGTVFFVEPIPATGTGEGGGGGGSTLHRYQLSARRAAAFVPSVGEYAVSADGKKLLYRTPGAAGGLFIVDADRTPPTGATGRLNVQLRMYVDPRVEYKQMFDEGWRIQRDYLYVKNLHGVEWAKMKEMYGQLLPYVSHRSDLNYLLDNMGAELAVGHSYVRGGDLPETPASTGGLLGADFAVDNGRYRITRIYDAESWNPELRAPLAAPGVDVRMGDYVLAVSGVDLRAPDNIYRLLDGTANRQTVLTVSAQATGGATRQVTVVPIANDQGLRTRAWVERNRRLVDSLSRGQLAYVYVPNTGQPGYTSFNRYYFAQQHKKGAIIDERFNGGGSAADYIIDILGRDFDGYFNNPVGERMPFTSPSAGIWGPKVMIINEMAGSGGDLMPYMFRFRKIGPLVGTRTWGGLVGTWDTPPFVDGGSMIAPRGGFFTREGKWAVENEGVGPDIEVENWPKEVIAGRDPQLERAVAEAMKMLGEKPVQRLNAEPTSPTWGRRPPPAF
jgi:tricorn protease